MTKGQQMHEVDWYGLGPGLRSACCSGWTQQELAEKASTTQHTISQAEQGKHTRMAVPVLVGIAYALNVTVEHCCMMIRFPQLRHPKAGQTE